MCVNNLPKVATQWNSGTTRDSNWGPRARISSALTTEPLRHKWLPCHFVEICLVFADMSDFTQHCWMLRVVKQLSVETVILLKSDVQSVVLHKPDQKSYESKIGEVNNSNVVIVSIFAKRLWKHVKANEMKWNKLWVRLLCRVHATQLNWRLSSVQFSSVCRFVHALSITQSLRSLRSVPYGHPKPRLFLLCWHRRDVDPSNAEDDMKPPRSSQAVATDRRDRTNRSS